MHIYIDSNNNSAEWMNQYYMKWENGTEDIVNKKLNPESKVNKKSNRKQSETATATVIALMAMNWVL